MNPSKYQQAIFGWVKNDSGSAIVGAVAGSGKTTTIVKALELIPASSAVAFLAFNKSIATELKARVPAHVEAMTLNSLGHRAWTKYAGKFCRLDANKTRSIIDTALTADEKINTAAVRKLVSLAKAHGLVPRSVRGATSLMPDTDDAWIALIDRFDVDINNDEETRGATIGEVIATSRRVLELSLSDRTVIDFDDQMYMTVALNAPVRRYDWLFVDEAQDVSPIQLALISKALKPGGRLVAVGDEHQSIYGFRGADSDSMAKIRRQFNCRTLPLSISYRCPRNIVAYAQRIVPHIEASDSAIDGELYCMPAIAPADFAPDDLVVCRNNKPLVALAYSLIARMVPVTVMGREIGAGLTSLITKLRPRGIDGEKGLVVKLAAWRTKETERALARGDETKAEAIADKADTILCFIENTRATTVPQLIAAIEAMFSDDKNTKRLTLASVHRAKGLEADRVFILDADLMPSKYARQEWQQRQEKNLEYVAITRAKKQLIFIRSGTLEAAQAARAYA